MADIVKILPDHIANQIAAGEVIQRPASVVKELVENAIDAQATKIQVIIKDAGKTHIQIIDNGIGMSVKDAEYCFKRHATSKVEKADDLFTLTTKGFRGEALASIAAIAHVRLKTKKTGDELGTLIENEGSKIKANESCVCSNGTSFEIKNLFYNVPARRNFLKSDQVEFNHIVDEFQRIVIAHPDLHFTLSHNDQEVYQLHATNLRRRIVDVFGKNTNEKLVPIEESTDIVSLKGFIGKPEFAKKSRTEQFFFVNNRYFKDTYLNHAINRAFEGLLQPKMYPSYFLFFEVDPKKIDVNVHPTKTEIKFEEDRMIYAILLSAVKQAIGKYQIAPTLDFDRETSFEIPFEMKSQKVIQPEIKVNIDYNPFDTDNSQRPISNRSYNNTSQAIQSKGFGNNILSQKDWEAFYDISESQGLMPQQEMELDFEENWTTKHFIAKGKFLFLPCKSGLMAIHSNRAFERIIYDDMMNQFRSKPIDSQKLLFPIERELTTIEASKWNDQKSLLERLGFYTEFHNNTLLINAIPIVLQDENISECMDNILENVAYRDIDKGEIAHQLILAIAKSGSNKKSALTNPENVEQMMEQLFQCTDHSHSPSGKKIIHNFTLEQIAINF